MRKYILIFSVVISSALCFHTLHAQKMYQRFADSEMKRFPEAWQLDHGKRLYFGYTQGLGCDAMLRVWKKTGDKKYYDYVHQWADTIIDSNGNIHLYNQEAYNLDLIEPGKVLFEIYKQTGDEKYKKAMDKLIEQLEKHPRISDGGYWHKKIYTNQMWLDGIYMSSPFMAQYGKEFNKPEWIEEAIKQITLCHKNCIDTKTGLYYHGYDESRTQKWADPVTGHSPNFWGRSVGWYFMAVVDALDFIPVDHPRRNELIKIIDDLTRALSKYQSKNGLWFQVLDKGDRSDNYEEASASSMYMYSIAKAVNKKYIDKKFKKIALKAYDGINKNLIRKNDDNTLSLTKCCTVAGLSGNPYRDGSYEYYVNERIRDDDAKATGSYIMGCIELNK